MTIFILIFFLLFIAYGYLIHLYQRWWNSIPPSAPGVPDRDTTPAQHDGHSDTQVRCAEDEPPKFQASGMGGSEQDRCADPGREQPVHHTTAHASIRIAAHSIAGGEQHSTGLLPAVSVVIALRNEQQHIPRLMGCLQQQDYPREHLEFILVDDQSTDQTLQLLQAYAAHDSTIRLLELPPGPGSKKQAIAAAVAAAKGELILTTDADCIMQPEWISTIAGFYRRTGAQFIAAPVKMAAGAPVKTSGHTVLGLLQILDFLTLQGITGASVYKQFHTMCNGANLAYTRAAFGEVNGFEEIDHIPSGDDMLLMYKIYRRYPRQVHYLKNPLAIVETEAEKTWQAFLHQRIRWASKSTHYRDKRIFGVLLLTYLINTGFLVLAVCSVLSIDWLPFLVLFLLAKVLIEYPFVYSVAVFFGQQKLMKFFPLLQPLHILYIILAGWLGRFGSYRWKSRVVRNTRSTTPLQP